MRTVRLVILAMTTVLGWAMASFLLRTNVAVWDEAVGMAVGVILAYPLVADLGVKEKDYLKFGLVMIVGVSVFMLLAGNVIPPEKRQSITLSVLAVAAGGMVVQSPRRRASQKCRGQQ